MKTAEEINGQPSTTFVVLLTDGKQMRVVVEREEGEYGRSTKREVRWHAAPEGQHSERFQDGTRVVKCWSGVGAYHALGLLLAAPSCGPTVMEWWLDGEKSRAELLAEIESRRDAAEDAGYEKDRRS